MSEAMSAALAESVRFNEWIEKDRASVARQIALQEFALQSRLLEISGLAEELGGSERANAALRNLMSTAEASGSPPDVAQWKRIVGTNEATGTFAVAQATVELASVALNFDSTYGDGAASKSGYKGDAGSAQLDVSNGSIEYMSSKDVSASGLNGKFALQMKVNVCPDAAGEILLEIVDKVALSSSKSGRGANTEFKATAKRTLDDDANMSELELQANLQSAEFGGGSGAFVDMDSVLSTSTGTIGTTVNRRSSKATDADVATVESLLLTIRTMAVSATELTRSVWEKGKCVKINAESTPSQRQRAKPSTAFDVYAGPRSKIDGSFVGGTVTATLSGGSSLQPANGKVRADAKFSYAAPTEKNQIAGISFESRSKRGVGKATLDFDTKAAGGYLMEGGAKELHFKGHACNLDQMFALQSDSPDTDVTIRFEPGSTGGGHYSYSGTMTGYDRGEKFTFRVHGNGIYQMSFANEVAVSASTNGSGTVETPFGPQTANGKENYTLRPLGEEPCVGLTP